MTATKPQSTTGPELKPCRCGRRALIERFHDGDDPQPLFVATCEVCPVKTYDQFTAEEAARIWNEFVSATVNIPDGQWQHVHIKAGNPRVVAIQFETAEQATAFINSFAASPASTAPPNHALIQLLDAALLHPESAEGNIRQVIESLASTAPVVDNLQRRLYQECVTANWDPERKNTFPEEIAHLHEELSEAFRAWRKYKDCEVREVNGKLEGVPIEFADALIGMFYNAELHGFDLLAAIEQKHQFNLRRNYVSEGRQLHPPTAADTDEILRQMRDVPAAATAAEYDSEPLTDAEVDTWLELHKNDPVDPAQANRVEWLFRKKLAASIVGKAAEWLRSYDERIAQGGKGAQDMERIYGKEAAFHREVIRAVKTLALEPPSAAATAARVDETKDRIP